MTGHGTKRRTIRADDEVYEPARAEAERRGEDLSAATRRFWKYYAAGGDVSAKE